MTWRLNWRQRRRYAWRVFASGLSFTLFGVCGLLLGSLALPLLYLVSTDEGQRKTRVRRAIGGAFVFFAGFMKLVGLIDVSVYGAAGLRARGAVIAPNHPSLIDVILLLAIAPQLECVVKRAAWRNPFMAGVVIAAGYIDNDLDGPALLARCADVISAGRSLLIFPEGTRTELGGLVHLRRGAAAIALAANAELVPVVIRCTPPALTKQHRWYDLPPDPLQIRIDVHPPWLATNYMARASNRAMAARKMTSDLEHFYRGELRDQHAHARADIRSSKGCAC